MNLALLNIAVGFIFICAGAAIGVLSVIVLIKLNKALDIWISKNKS